MYIPLKFSCLLKHQSYWFSLSNAEREFPLLSNPSDIFPEVVNSSARRRANLLIHFNDLTDSDQALRIEWILATIDLPQSRHQDTPKAWEMQTAYLLRTLYADLFFAPFSPSSQTIVFFLNLEQRVIPRTKNFHVCRCASKSCAVDDPMRLRTATAPT